MNIAAIHQLGTKTPNAQNWNQAMQAAGLNWSVEKRDIYSRQPVTNAVFKLPDSRGVFRNDNGAYLGVVGDGFGLVQNAEAFNWLDDVLGTAHASWDSAGFLGAGERIWACAKMPQSFTINGTADRTDFYMMFATAHDGSLACQANIIGLRLVCSNGLRVMSSFKSLMRVKHTSGVSARLEASKRVTLEAVSAINGYGETMNKLASRRMTRASMMSVLNRLFPAQQDGERSTKTDNVAKQVLELFQSNDRGAFPQIAGSAYNLLNAVTEYTDHHRSARLTEGRTGYTVSQARAENALFGTGDKFKQTALAVIEEETIEAPVHDLIHTPSAAELHRLYSL